VLDAHVSEYIDIGVELNKIRYKKDNFKIWTIITDRLSSILHSFDIAQLIKLQWVLDSQKPKIGSRTFYNVSRIT
jgi:hypothetical protein